MVRKSKKVSHRRKRRKSSSSHKNFSQALQRLKKLKASEQHQAMSMANNAFIRQFCKSLKKMKHVKLSGKKSSALRKHKKQIRQLINARTAMSKRRQILSQKGSGLLKNLLSIFPGVGPVLRALPWDF